MFREAIIEAAKFRARMMRELVIAQGHPRLADEAFLAGSLSLIDTYLHIGMDEIIGRIHLDKPIVDALLIREGYLGKLLKIAEKLETTENLQTVIENLAPKLNITAEKLYGIYCEASKTESEEAKGDEAR
jgi:EAL and modified HD-GYP domain-containing signal transduction protein